MYTYNILCLVYVSALRMPPVLPCPAAHCWHLLFPILLSICRNAKASTALASMRSNSYKAPSPPKPFGDAQSAEAALQ